MKFTLSWLKNFLNTSASLEGIADNLTSIGFEVEEIKDRREELKDFTVAYIVATEPHPTAGKLKICQVQTNDGIKQIVCGAPNAREGIKVALAKIGATVPNGQLKIKEAEIRGVKSYGMLCSEQELQVGENSNGIIELPGDAKVGESILKYYGLDDPLIHINVTPNRPDVLGVYGIARELAAKGVGQLLPLQVPEIVNSFKSSFSVSLDASSCTLFAVREIRDVNNYQSPLWLRQLLRNIGVSSISPLVDIANYISYSFAQPMHIYDADKLSRNIKVGLPPPAHKVVFTALNNKEYTLKHTGEDYPLIISDDKETHCLAGIIGGAASACSVDTKNALLEAACFDKVAIAKSVREYSIASDSSYRFERGVDQAFTLKVMDIATQLILELCDGSASQIIWAGEQTVKSKKITFPSIKDFLSFLYKISGMDFTYLEVSHILQKLGFVLEESGDSNAADNPQLEIKVPSWRNDVNIKEDIAEEVLRIYGYDKLPEIPLPAASNLLRIIPPYYTRTIDIKRVLANRGLSEVVTWSFMDINEAAMFGEINNNLLIVNPISQELNYMRASIIPNLLRLAAKNFARSIKDLSLFEVGPIFSTTEAEGETCFAAGLRIGQNVPKNCYSKGQIFDVYDVKTDIAAILSHLGLAIDKCQISEINLPYYHKTRSACLKLGKTIIGYFGQLQPTIAKHYDLANSEVVIFEINISALPPAKVRSGQKADFNPSHFQPTSRDYAFIIAKDQPVGEILSCIKNIDPHLIKSVELFDLYLDEKVGSNNKSIAVSVQIQANNRTLTEMDLINLNQLIIEKVEQKFAAKLRDATSI